MQSDELKDKIAKLPAWARDHIKRLETQREPLLDEAVRARRERDAAVERAKRLSSSNEALLEILRCAGKGGNDWAKQVTSVLDSYEIFKTANE